MARMLRSVLTISWKRVTCLASTSACLFVTATSLTTTTSSPDASFCKLNCTQGAGDKHHSQGKPSTAAEMQSSVGSQARSAQPRGGRIGGPQCRSWYKSGFLMPSRGSANRISGCHHWPPRPSPRGALPAVRSHLHLCRADVLPP